MQLSADGAQHFPAAIGDEYLVGLAALLAGHVPKRSAGARLPPLRPLPPLLADSNAIAVSVLGRRARPVFAKFFEKSPERNWTLGWHQDRTVAMRERIDTPGFSAWTLKHGIHHAVPPFEIIERMLTLRIHIDAAGADNAPLLIVPGSHRLGPIPEAEIRAVLSDLGTASCDAAAGDVWLYATPILHASARADSPRRRRVLQVHYSADELLGGLAWLGI